MRRFLGAALLVGTTLGGAGCGGGGDAATRPNVIFIVCDTLRADRMSTYGHGRETTPNIDALAADGTVFEHATSMSSWTLPSMSMLMTGEVKSLADTSILVDHVHVAENFAAAGYTTGAVVANPILNERLGYDRGVGHFELEPRREMAWRAGEVFGKGLDWLDGETTDAPFFLWLHPVDPHHPYEPEGGARFGPLDEGNVRAAAAADLERVRVDHPDALPGGDLDARAWATIQESRDLYDAEIFEFDAAVGQLMEDLAERGLADNTVVVITSDHGEGLWERPGNPDDKERDAFFPALYRRHGLMLHDEQVRIPLVFHGPGVPAGERRGGFVQHIDVVPTLLALCNVPVKKALAGRALFEEDGDRDPGPIFAVCSRSHSVTVDERWRLHLPKEHRVRKSGIEPRLYDLQTDPGERSPIDDPERIAEMTALIEAWTVEHAPIKMGAKLDAETIESLKALGYGGEVETRNMTGKDDK